VSGFSTIEAGFAGALGAVSGNVSHLVAVVTGRFIGAL